MNAANSKVIPKIIRSWSFNLFLVQTIVKALKGKERDRNISRRNKMALFDLPNFLCGTFSRTFNL